MNERKTSEWDSNVQFFCKVVIYLVRLRCFRTLRDKLYRSYFLFRIDYITSKKCTSQFIKPYRTLGAFFYLKTHYLLYLFWHYMKGFFSRTLYFIRGQLLASLLLCKKKNQNNMLCVFSSSQNLEILHHSAESTVQGFVPSA